MNKSVQDAASFYEAIRFNPATTADEAKTHIQILEGIEYDWLKQLAASNTRGVKKARFLLWNGAMLGFMMALKTVKTVGDAGLAEERGLSAH